MLIKAARRVNQFINNHGVLFAVVHLPFGEPRLGITRSTSNRRRLTNRAKKCVLFLFSSLAGFLMSYRYEFARAAGEKNLVLIFTEGSFETLPFEVRLSARWTGLGYGKIGELKMEDRRALLAHGYAVVREAAGETAEPAPMPDAAPIAAAPGLRQAA